MGKVLGRVALIICQRFSTLEDVQVFFVIVDGVDYQCGCPESNPKTAFFIIQLQFRKQDGKLPDHDVEILQTP